MVTRSLADKTPISLFEKDSFTLLQDSKSFQF
jgi:hypothetical protein